MKIDGRFWLTKDDKNFLGSGRIELLERIDKTGSIHAAAKEMKMSYKAAWERINGMNLLADQPLIERTTGGKGGGGTKLTPYAHELIKTFHRFKELHRQFIDRFSEAGEDPERLARILGRTFLTTSARNQLPATLQKIEVDGLNAALTLALPGNDFLQSTITAKSVHNMGLTPGCDAYAIIKSSDITVSTSETLNKEETDNILSGTVKSIEQIGENTEIAFELDGGTLLIALQHGHVSSIASEERGYIRIAPQHIIIGL